MFKGKLIVIEGIDACGKTTHSKKLVQAMNATWLGFPARSTFYGKLIDGWLKGEWSCSGGADAAVFQAIQTCNRLECLPTMEHLLLNGENIVCDRYWPSGVVYGCADGLEKKLLMTLHQFFPQPDLCILLDTPVEVARARRSGAKLDKYESRGSAYYEAIRESYLELFREQLISKPWAWCCVNGDGAVDAVQAAIQQTVRRNLGDWV